MEPEQSESLFLQSDLARYFDLLLNKEFYLDTLSRHRGKTLELSPNLPCLQSECTK